MNDVYVVRIQPDGTVFAVSTQQGGYRYAADAARKEGGIESIDIVTLPNPILGHGVFVGAIDDWGATYDPPLPVNRKAWALYGRSPIHGPMWLANDYNEPLDTMLIDMLTGDEWIGHDIDVAMDEWLIQHG